MKPTGFHTHLPALVAAFTRTTGDILEVGGGLYSTPVLHELAAAAGRKLVTAEVNPEWSTRLNKLAGANHQFLKLPGFTKWADVPPDHDLSVFEKDWGLIFIDIGAMHPVWESFVNVAIAWGAVVVFHGVEGQFQQSLESFPYRKVIDHLRPWPTHIVSVTERVDLWDIFEPEEGFEQLPIEIEGIKNPKQKPIMKQPQVVTPLPDGGEVVGVPDATFQRFANDKFRNTEDQGQSRRVPHQPKQKTGLVLYTPRGHSVSLENQYHGESAFLVLSGPSAKDLDLPRTLQGQRGVVTMCVNNSWSLVKPNLWTAVDDPNTFLDAGWKDPSILKLVPYGKEDHRLGLKTTGGFKWSGKRVRDMPNVFYYKRNDRFDPDTYLHEDTVNWGCHQNVKDKLGCQGSRSVMLAAVRLLYYFGFKNVYLVGADFNMQEGSGAYAFGQHKDRKGAKGNNNTYRDLNIRFKYMRKMMEDSGFHIYNTFKGSKLEAFDHVPYDEAVKRVTERFNHIDPVGWYDAWVGPNGKKVQQGVDPPKRA